MRIVSKIRDLLKLKRFSGKHIEDIRIIPTYRCNRDCSYCYAKGLLKKYPKDMTVEGFARVLDWKLEKKLGSRVGITGGEPTVHPDLLEMQREGKERGIRFDLNTNNLYEKPVIDPEAVWALRIHYADPAFFSEKQHELFLKNLKDADDNGLTIVLRHNIYSKDTPYAHILEACRNFSIDKVVFGITYMSVSKDNDYVREDHVRELVPNIMDLVGDLKDMGVYVRFNRPVPLCEFSDEEREYLVENAELSGLCRGMYGRSTNRVVVNPDFSVFPCTILPLEGPKLFSFKGESDIKDYYEKQVTELKWKPLFEKCLDCVFYEKKQCQGTCLGNKCSLNCF